MENEEKKENIDVKEDNKVIDNGKKNNNNKKESLSIFTNILIIIIVIAACIGAYFLITNLYLKNSNTETDTLVSESEEKEETITSEPLYTMENLPKIDASLATQPLVQAFMKNFTATDNIDFDSYGFSNTHPGYVKLINDEVDLIVVTSPSDEELQLAKEKGVELEVIPVVKEGFVFYVNSDNKVNNLTVEQVQDIYSGKIRNWKEVGGEDSDIIAYQRPTNSGSQTGMLNLVMKDKPLMSAPKENLVETMAQIINLVSSYDNGKDSIGYSYYYYATTMYETIDKDVASGIKLLSINGVEPNVKNIKSEKYPFTTAYYIVINKADGPDSPARKLANQMLSARGQKVALDAGYVPVK